MSTAWTPPGHCPHCGYAMAAGRCSECGQDVAADQLVPTPAWVMQRKHLKRLVVVCSLSIFFVVGYWVYDLADWPSWLPTKVLLWCESSPDARTGKELWTRFLAGKMSQAQADTLLSKSVSCPEGLKVRSPHPCDIDVYLTAAIDARVPRNNLSVRVMQATVLVDGQPVIPRKQQFTGFGWNGGPVAFPCYLPPLCEGEHTVEYDLVVGLRVSGIPTLPPGTRIPSTSLHLQSTVQVTDKHMDHYVEPVWSSDWATNGEIRVLANLRQADYSSDPGFDLVKARCPVPIAGRIWVRKQGQEDFSPTDCVFIADVEGSYCRGFSAQHLVGKNHSQPVDIRLVPDRQTAFEAGFTKYLGATIEWRGLEMSPATQAISFRPSEVATRVPDRFFVQEQPAEHAH